MSFSVRRMGVLAISMFLQTLSIEDVKKEELLKFNPTEEGKVNHDLSPILEFKRTEVDNFEDFIEYMIRDDDWEVRKNMVELIEEIMGTFMKQKLTNQFDWLDKKLDFLAEDHVLAVAKQAKVAQGINRRPDEKYSTERLEEILTDIELNLAVIHDDGKLEFSGDEGDDNFADCY